MTEKLSNSKQTKVTLKNGTTFTIQKPGAQWYMDFVDKCKNQFGVIQQGQYVPGLLKNCVVENPKIDDFDDCMDSLSELVTEIETFLRVR